MFQPQHERVERYRPARGGVRARFAACKLVALAVGLLVTTAAGARANPFDATYYFLDTAPADSATANNAIRIRIKDVSNFALNVTADFLSDAGYQEQAGNYPDTSCT